MAFHSEKLKSRTRSWTSKVRSTLHLIIIMILEKSVMNKFWRKCNTRVFLQETWKRASFLPQLLQVADTKLCAKKVQNVSEPRKNQLVKTTVSKLGTKSGRQKGYLIRTVITY